MSLYLKQPIEIIICTPIDDMLIIIKPSKENKDIKENSKLKKIATTMNNIEFCRSNIMFFITLIKTKSNGLILIEPKGEFSNNVVLSFTNI